MDDLTCKDADRRPTDGQPRPQFRREELEDLRMLTRLGRLSTMLLGLAVLSGISCVADASSVPLPANAPWFNVSRPLEPRDLRGRVVLLDFFTPGCINCIHMLPEMTRLERAFGGRLLILGVDSPKFDASRDAKNIQAFIQRYHVTHPVLIDEGMTLWDHYGVEAWPTLVLLGPQGGVVRTFIGEGHDAAIARAISTTLSRAERTRELATGRLPLQPLAVNPNGLLQPGKVAVSARYVAISDTGHNRIVLLNHQGRVLRVFGTGGPGHVDGPAGIAQFHEPEGLAFAGDSLYVADTGNSLIRCIDLASNTVKTIAGNGHRAFGGGPVKVGRDAELNSPWALKVLGHTLLIAMAGDHQLWSMNLATGGIGPYAGDGLEGISNGPRASASFAQSSGLAYHAGTLYVADPEASAVRAVDLRTGYVHTLIGKGLFVFGLRNGIAADALLQHDQGLAWEDGKLYIADTFNDAVRVLDPVTSRVATLASGLSQPGGVAAFGPRDLLVANTGDDDIVRLSLRDGVVHAWPVKGLPPAH